MNDEKKNRQELSDAISTIRAAQLDTGNGMPEELFLTVSALIPVVNVDLLVVNDKRQLLLSRRNDGFFENSWHLPGGCMRYGESFSDRIRETALRELGTTVLAEPQPLAVRNVIRGPNPGQRYPRERGHNVAILFSCRLPEGFQISNAGKTENDDGFLRWFDSLPSDFMKIQRVFEDVLAPWMKRTDCR